MSLSVILRLITVRLLFVFILKFDVKVRANQKIPSYFVKLVKTRKKTVDRIFEMF